MAQGLRAFPLWAFNCAESPLWCHPPDRPLAQLLVRMCGRKHRCNLELFNSHQTASAMAAISFYWYHALGLPVLVRIVCRFEKAKVGTSEFVSSATAPRYILQKRCGNDICAGLSRTDHAKAKLCAVTNVLTAFVTSLSQEHETRLGTQS